MLQNRIIESGHSSDYLKLVDLTKTNILVYSIFRIKKFIDYVSNDNIECSILYANIE